MKARNHGIIYKIFLRPGGEVTFHFFGGKHDGNKVREALNNLMKRGRLGNVTLVPTHLAFKQEPTLLLQVSQLNSVTFNCFLIFRVLIDK